MNEPETPLPSARENTPPKYEYRHIKGICGQRDGHYVVSGTGANPPVVAEVKTMEFGELIARLLNMAHDRLAKTIENLDK